MRLFAACLSLLLAACGNPARETVIPAAGAAPARDPSPRAAGPGFRSVELFEEHYQKHGPEFGSVTKEQYLQLAQELRDAPAGGPILESIRADGVISRFDRRHGYFGAYNRNGTIRTFFIPNDGERYFVRQARKSHD
jgi:pyocin large subunit-like protein